MWRRVVWYMFDNLDDSVVFITSICDSGRDFSETLANIYLTVWYHVQKNFYTHSYRNHFRCIRKIAKSDY